MDIEVDNLRLTGEPGRGDVLAMCDVRYGEITIHNVIVYEETNDRTMVRVKFPSLTRGSGRSTSMSTRLFRIMADAVVSEYRHASGNDVGTARNFPGRRVVTVDTTEILRRAGI